MRIHHLRNATMVIETHNDFILVDPMLGKKGSMAPFTLFRFKPRKNPLVELPSSATHLLDKVTCCLVTHLHPDHFDDDAVRFLQARDIPVVCSAKDESTILKKGIRISDALAYWKEVPFLGGRLVGIPAVHGYGFIAKPMGNVMGFFFALPGEKSVYISADTVYTSDVRKVLHELVPDVSVLACGSAQLDIGQPLLMRMEDLIRFIREAPGKVLANHLEALNHCPTTRQQLKAEVIAHQLQHKVDIPEDGTSVLYSR